MLSHKNTRHVHTYWRERCRGGRIPDRTDIEPAAIAKALGTTVILQNRNNRGYTFQLAGSRLCMVAGRELQGEPISAFFNGSDLAPLEQGLRAVETEHTFVIYGMTGFTHDARTVAFETVFMPLSSEAPTILGVIQHLSTPLWLGTQPVIGLQIETIRMMEYERELFALQNRPAIPVPHMQTRPSHRTASPAHLRVIDGAASHPSAQRAVELRVLEGGKPPASDTY